MPNQQNFNSNLNTAITSSARFLTSRVINVPSELILLETVNSAFGTSANDYIEIHLYTIPTNALILTTTITPSDPFISAHVVRHADNTLKNYLKIEFTRLFNEKRLVVVPGDYYMVMNFFTEEIGNYNNKLLKIDRISADRTEVEISFVNNSSAVFEQNKKIMREFALPYFLKESMAVFTDEVFGKLATTLTALEKVSPNQIIKNNYIVPTFDPDSIEPNTELDRILSRLSKLGVTPAVEAAIRQVFNDLCTKIIQELNAKGDIRIQRDEYESYLRTAIQIYIAQITNFLRGRGLLIT